MESGPEAAGERRGSTDSTFSDVTVTLETCKDFRSGLKILSPDQNFLKFRA